MSPKSTLESKRLSFFVLFTKKAAKARKVVKKQIWGFADDLLTVVNTRLLSFSMLPLHLFSQPRVGSKSRPGKTRDNNCLGYRTVRDLSILSETTLSFLFSHPQYLLLPPLLNRLQDAEKSLPLTVPPAHSAFPVAPILSQPFVRRRSHRVRDVKHPNQGTRRPHHNTTSLLVIVSSPQLSGSS